MIFTCFILAGDAARTMLFPKLTVIANTNIKDIKFLLICFHLPFLICSCLEIIREFEIIVLCVIILSCKGIFVYNSGE